MRKEPEFQKQHKIPVVYLRRFGYKKNDKLWVSVLEVESGINKNILISNFTTEINIFDLPFKDIEYKRYYENSFKKIEDHYNTIINNLTYQNKLTKKDNEYLNHFIANILCRTNPTRLNILEFLKDNELKNKFLHEITLFIECEKDLTKILELFKVDFQLNVVLGVVMNHFVYALRSFNKLIIKNVDIDWLTTDSPVYIDKQGQEGWLLPIESEIYLPLSKDFCLFMYHPKSEMISNPLRDLLINRVNVIDFDTFNNITMKIVSNFDKYLIYNTEHKQGKI